MVRSSLSQGMIVRCGILAGWLWTTSWSGRAEITMPPTWIERWRGASINSLAEFDHELSRRRPSTGKPSPLSSVSIEPRSYRSTVFARVSI